MTNYTNVNEYYKFTIENKNLDAEGAVAGFVDGMKSMEYSDFNEESTEDISLYEAKARGYIRWFNLCLQLSQFGVMYMKVDELTDATSLKVPSKIVFTMGYEQPDAMYIKDKDGTVYKGIDALKQLVAKSLCNNYSMFAPVFDPTVNDSSKNPSFARYGVSDRKLTAERLFDTIDEAKASVTIEKIDNPFDKSENSN